MGDVCGHVVVVDRAGTIVMVGREAARVFGYSQDRLLTESVDLLLAPEGHAAQALLRETLFAEAEGPPAEGSRHEGLRPEESVSRLHGLHRDGSRFPIEVRWSVLASGDGRFVSAVIRAQSEQDTTDSVRSRLASLVDSAQDAIIGADLDGNIDSWNRAAEKLFGYSAAEAIGQPAGFLKPTALQDLTSDKVGEIRRGGVVPSSETVRRTKAGRNIDVAITHSSIQDPQGKVIGTSIVVRDLTEHRKSEATRFHLAAIIEHSGAAIIATDLDGRITAWNTAAEKLYGYPDDEVLGQPGSLLIPPGQEDGDDLYERLRRGEVVPPYDAVRRRKDGVCLDVSISPSSIRDAAGTIVGFSAFVHDITERKQTEQALEAAHEATLIASHEYESFAYAVAHDLRTPLRGISGFVYLGQEEYEAGRPDSGRAQLNRARSSAEQMGRLIDSLLRLAQMSRQPMKRSTVDLSLIADSAIARLRDEFPTRAVETIVAPEIITTGDADLLSIVLRNLLDNAWKFTRHRPQARIEFGREGEEFFVTDNGAGFDMAHYDKLFGLFQRLHHQNEFEGTGIGLATTQRIIRRHGGRIWAESALDHGSTFTFTVPPMRS